MTKKQIYRAKAKPSHKAPPKRVLVIGAVLLCVLLIGGYAWYRHSHPKPRSIITADGQTVNLEPATNEEKAQTEAHKDNIVSDSEKAKSTATGQMKQSTVVINQASGTGVTAYVTGVFEEGGNCTATAVSGSQTITKSSVGFQNASYTQCVPIQWDSPLAKGSWNITVTYKSAQTESTASKTIEVQ